MRYRVLSCLLGLVVVALAGAPGVSAQLAPEVPPGHMCQVQPASFLSVLDVLNRMDQARWTHMGSVSEFELERGDSLTAEDAGAIEYTLYQLVSCANAVSPLQVLALLEEDFQARLLVGIVDGDDLDAVIQQVPLIATETVETEGIPMVTIIEAWYTPGSTRTIQAVVEPYMSDPENRAQFLVTFQWDVDRWVISMINLIE